eukprot:8356082-Alexandrium_andersonii.AAC.1
MGLPTGYATAGDVVDDSAIDAIGDAADANALSCWVRPFVEQGDTLWADGQHFNLPARGQAMCFILDYAKAK